jgi:HlyD family secretion protein
VSASPRQDAPPGETPMRKRSALWASAIAIVIAVALVATYLAVPPWVETTTPQVRDLRRTLVVAGSVRPPSTAGPGAAVAGVVARVPVREGDRVRAGETLVELEGSEARAAVAQAEATLVEAGGAARSGIEQGELEL